MKGDEAMSNSPSAIRSEPGAENAILAIVGIAVEQDNNFFRSVLEALPVAIYLTDPDGRITFYNEAAAKLWGHRPEIGKSEWCGSWKLFRPDGTPMQHSECPMAIAVRERRPLRGTEAIAERPDGSRVPFTPFPTPLFDRSGAFVGAVNLLVDISDRKRAERMSRRIASIVETTDDAIVGTDFNGIITVWNAGAEKLLGYSRDEAVGKPVVDLIFGERHEEHEEMLAIVRQGGHIENYQTVRYRKDGTPVEVSISVAPIKGGDERSVGVSTIMRDFSEIKRSMDQRDLLLREMNHRVKNVFQLASGVVSLSARTAETPKQLAAAVQQRLAALGRAHALTLTGFTASEAGSDQPTTLHALIRAIVLPYVDDQKDHRIALAGTDVVLAGSAVTSLALLLNEFATNAAKYGALSTPEGRISVTWSAVGEELKLRWAEAGGPVADQPPSLEFGGFGSFLARTVASQFGGSISREWAGDGLVIHVSAALECFTGQDQTAAVR
jgi:PAS domain S-box-containing protein